MTYRRAYIGVVVIQGLVAAAGRRQLAGAMRLLDQHGGLAALDLLVVLAGHVRHHVAGERRREEQRAMVPCFIISNPSLVQGTVFAAGTTSYQLDRGSVQPGRYL